MCLSAICIPSTKQKKYEPVSINKCNQCQNYFVMKTMLKDGNTATYLIAQCGKNVLQVTTEQSPFFVLSFLSQFFGEKKTQYSCFDSNGDNY